MSKYCKDLVDQICTLVEEDTYSIPEICINVGITESTYHKWKAEKKEFSDSIKAAEKSRNEKFAVSARKSLKKLIEGYTSTEKKEKRVLLVDIEEVVKEKGKKDKKKMKKVAADRKTTQKQLQKAAEKPEYITIEETIITKEIAPNANTVMFTLVNTDSENFKNQHSAEIDLGKNLTAQIIVEKIETGVPLASSEEEVAE